MTAKKTTAKKTAKAASKSRSRTATKAPAKKPATAKTAAKKATPAKKTTTRRKKQQQHAVSRVDTFVERYVIHRNGRLAAVEAGFSPRSARQTASELLAKPDVQEKVRAALDEISKRNGMEADDVAARLIGMATADAREISEVWRCNCRYCWGKDNKYLRTPAEMAAARAEWTRELKKAGASEKDHPFDEQGGIGWNPYHDPNPDCPECFGHGIERVLIKDTRDLSPEARLIYAGAKLTQHGLQVMTIDQKSALIDYGKHIGMFTKKFEGKVDHTHQGLEELLDEIDGAGTGIPGDGTD
jgi:phage terminase small subunit